MKSNTYTSIISGNQEIIPHKKYQSHSVFERFSIPIFINLYCFNKSQKETLSK